ncbi:hypothetical protein [Haladaptatus sp. W1]|nr:hypothetical protein [Haladaptatus sp. W1]
MGKYFVDAERFHARILQQSAVRKRTQQLPTGRSNRLAGDCR